MSESLEYSFVKEEVPTNVKRGTMFNIVTRNVNGYTHGLHKYPAKFIPQIPRWAIEKYLQDAKGGYVLDPFCGSGTTLVESLIAGYNAIGLDIDPLSILISKVKTTKINKAELIKIKTWLVDELKKNLKSSFYPECENIEHWFSKDAIKKLSIIRTLLNRIPEQFGNTKKVKDIQNLFFVCFSSIIRRVSNADNQSQKTYVSHTNVKEPEEVYALFLDRLEYFTDCALNFSKKVRPGLKSNVVVASSSTSVKKLLYGKDIGLVITSPPYIKAIDYIYNQMVELFWIGDLFNMQTQIKQNQKKPHYIGNKQIYKSEFADYSPHVQKLNIQKLDKKLQEINDSDKKNGHKHSYITYKYFLEMEKHFSELGKYISKNTHYILVVGDSNVSDVYIDTANFLTKIAERNGFKITNRWGYKIKNRYMRFNRKGRGGIIEDDWVLDFKKT